MKKFLCLVVMAFLLSGCADPKIDVSNEEIQKKSIEKVRNALSEQKRSEFDNAMKIIVFSSVNLFNPKESEYAMKNAVQTLQGKTGNDVIAEGKRIKEERAAKEKEQAAKEREDVLGKIKDLESKKALVETAKAELAKFKIISASFYKKDKKIMDRVIGKEPAIDLKVKNETGYPVSRAYFTGTLSSQGRAVPWLREDFNYSISGGLEKGEEVTWHLAPNPYGKWGTATSEAPDNAVLTVEVVRLDGADDKALFDSKDFSDSEEESLKTMKTKLSKIDALLQGAKK